ncbi:hypothetical protein ACPPVW_01640 [Leifsonia sp. McL0607]|uniref:hypothetical protein n=1 Tax=Leifsonia sp. McL0607 TaxID=3415672 RepID=UPI003CF54BE1
MNSRITIEHDGSPLVGSLELDGAKHSFAHVLASAALHDEGLLSNVPNNVDSQSLMVGLRAIFENVAFDEANATVAFSSPIDGAVEFSGQLVARSRSLFVLLPAALHHASEVTLEGLPTGCDIGQRPYQWYFDILETFGVAISDSGSGAVVMSWVCRVPARIDFTYPTMTGSVIAIAAAQVAGGVSHLRGCTVEPSCEEQVDAARANGAVVRGSLPSLTIDAGSHNQPFEWLVGADRVHAVTLLTAGLLTRGEVTVKHPRSLRIPKFIDFCGHLGAEVDSTDTSTTVRHPLVRELRACDLRTGCEPLFSTDWLPFAALLIATRTEGTAELTDDVFPERLQFFHQLYEMGLGSARIGKVDLGGRSAVRAIITGDPETVLRHRVFDRCPDIRGTSALVLSALISDGPCTLENDFQLRRGYASLPSQLRELGLHNVQSTESRTAQRA